MFFGVIQGEKAEEKKDGCIIMKIVFVLAVIVSLRFSPKKEKSEHKHQQRRKKECQVLWHRNEE